MFRYAQVNSEGYIVSDSYLSGEVIAENMIQIDFDYDLTNKKYNFETKEFEEYTPTAQETEPTLEEIQTMTYLNTEYLVIMSELNNL